MIVTEDKQNNWFGFTVLMLTYRFQPLILVFEFQTFNSNFHGIHLPPP